MMISEVNGKSHGITGTHGRMSARQAFRRTREISQEEGGLMWRLEGCVRWIRAGPLKNTGFSSNQSSTWDGLELGKSGASVNDWKISGLKCHEQGWAEGIRGCWRGGQNFMSWGGADNNDLGKYTHVFTLGYQAKSFWDSSGKLLQQPSGWPPHLHPFPIFQPNKWFLTNYAAALNGSGAPCCQEHRV